MASVYCCILLVLIRQTTEVSIDLSTTFLWTTAAIFMLLGGAKESNFTRGQVLCLNLCKKKKSVSSFKGCTSSQSTSRLVFRAWSLNTSY